LSVLNITRIFDIMTNIFNQIVKISIYLLVFLLPLFWLPFSFEMFEFNKQYLLFFLVSIAFFAWLAKMILIDKEIRFRRTPLDIFVLAFIFIAILSAIFSVDKGLSLFGFYGRFSDGLIGLLSLGVLYFLITNNVQLLISMSGLVKTLLGSVFFVILFSYFSIFGLWARAGWQLPGIMLQRTFNPVSGSLEGLAIFLAVMVVFLVGLIMIRDDKGAIRDDKGMIRDDKGMIEDDKGMIRDDKGMIRKLGKIIKGLLLLASLFLLLIIDFTASWIVLAVSLVLFTGLALWQRMFRENVNKLLLPICLIIIAGAGLFINTAGIANEILGRETLLREQILDQKTSWQVATRTVTDNVKQGFLGTGIGTFSYNFSKEKPIEFNESPLWFIRFDRAGSQIAEVLGTMGFLGLFSYLVLLGMFLLVSWLLIGDVKGGKGNYLLPLLVAFLALLAAQFVYYQNTVLAFAFWLVLALSVVSWQKPIKEKKFSFKEFPELSLVFSVLLILVGLALAGTFFFAQQFYRADMIYAQSQRMAPGPERTGLIEKAKDLNPYLAQYQAILARAYLEQALIEMRKPVADQDATIIEIAVARAIEAARASTLRSPGQVATWETLAMVYRDIRLVAEGAKEWAISSFRRAIELEPTNPILYTELGKLLAIENPEEARKEFIRALELKPDYFDASIQLARIYEAQNNLAEAIKTIEGALNRLAAVAPQENLILVFELGRLFYNDGRINEARFAFERVLEVFPLHSDALYSLAVIHQEKGETDRAINLFERVLELNPGNQEVIRRIEELKK